MVTASQVFISHDTDDEGFAHRLANDLRALGLRIWIAPDSIRPGEDWVDAINRGLEESSHMVLVLTPAALGSDWVRKETSAAINLESQGRIELIPLRVKPCRVPALWDNYQAVSFRHDYQAGLRQLTGRLGWRAQAPVRTSTSRAAVEDRLRSILSDLVGYDKPAIRTVTRLREDLGMDELDLVEVLMELEDQWGVVIPDSDVVEGGEVLGERDWKFKTVGDLVTYLMRHVGS